MQVTPNQDFFNRKKVSISSISDNYFYSVHCKVLESLEVKRYVIRRQQNSSATPEGEENGNQAKMLTAQAAKKLPLC